MVCRASWVGKELSNLLAMLSPQQATGVQRIVEAELAGKTLSSLLDCPGQICTSTTYYGSGKRRGWRDKATFVQALEQARRDYRTWLMEHGAGDALVILASTAPDAARILHRQISGDDGAVLALVAILKTGTTEEKTAAAEQLGQAGLPSAVAALQQAYEAETDAGIRGAIIAALGRIAGERDPGRRAAATDVLDRTSVATATKRSVDVGGAAVAAITLMSEVELDQLLSNLEAAEGGGTGGAPAAEAGE